MQHKTSKYKIQRQGTIFFKGFRGVRFWNYLSSCTVIPRYREVEGVGQTIRCIYTFVIFTYRINLTKNA